MEQINGAVVAEVDELCRDALAIELGQTDVAVPQAPPALVGECTIAVVTVLAAVGERDQVERHHGLAIDLVLGPQPRQVLVIAGFEVLLPQLGWHGGVPVG